MATFKPLIADSLCVAYGKADVLNSVHVEINPGEITCLLGSNGAGKTTFIRALTGLTKPHAGTIQFDGLEITGLPPHRSSARFSSSSVWPGASSLIRRRQSAGAAGGRV